MNRTEFEYLRDLPDKVIGADLRLTQRKETSPAWVADGIVIENVAEVQLRLNITYNPETGSKTFNVHVPGVGPICRLDVDGTSHKDQGRTHKHSLKTERCPARNLPWAVAMPALAGLPLLEVFRSFCEMANIRHEGSFEDPSEEIDE